tara:strand:+ start:1724 stop:1891 length:168 start_codon:yes stop_codon:yes gene_type:complete
MSEALNYCEMHGKHLERSSLRYWVDSGKLQTVKRGRLRYVEREHLRSVLLRELSF